MNRVELAKGVYYVGAVDWNVRDFHGYTTPRGVTYNAYLIVDEKIALIDLVKAPFAGELLQVREEARDWEGAIERLLHGFGLSLLVPDASYAQVAEWVDQTHLRGRLVYFRVRAGGRDERPQLHPDSLVRKLQIKPDSPLYGWIEREVAHRFDLACCRSQEQFRRETRAITRAGQIKAPGERHEKDDRHRLEDRRRYVLGWRNDEKIAALEKEAGRQEALSVVQRDAVAARVPGMGHHPGQGQVFVEPRVAEEALALPGREQPDLVAARAPAVRAVEMDPAPLFDVASEQ